ncbi:hypothetical protein WICPIJ_003651 [Wickerhamomyces pijperi]|uniref:RRM domain-containing protein n=1 Tax=Wickerhamomyces pijperi TaxID=599730 RepID=A0A9P8TNH8_WICPI|nr:hypothetical protein WICPIJ_003651 [Wickerhamomyces pijperi]
MTVPEPSTGSTESDPKPAPASTPDTMPDPSSNQSEPRSNASSTEDSQLNQDDEYHYHSPLNNNVVLTITYTCSEDQSESTAHSEIKFDEILQWISDKLPEYPFQMLNTEYDRTFAETCEEGTVQLRLKFLNKVGFEETVLGPLSSAFASDNDDDNVKYTIDFKADYDCLINPGNLFIKNIAPDVTVPELLSLLSEHGKVKNCKIIQPSLTSGSSSNGTNYGFVNYEQGKDALSAINSLNGKTFHGADLYVNHHISKQQRLETTLEFFTNVYIKNIPFEFTKVDILNLFQKFGGICSVHLPNLLPSRPNSSAGDINAQQVKYGFINFANHSSALSSIMVMNGFEVKPGVFLQITKAQRRQDFIGYVHPFFGQQQQQQQQQQHRQHHHHHHKHATKQSLDSSKPAPGPNDQQTNLYIKNLPLNITDEHLNELFKPFGEIISVKVITFEDKSDSTKPNESEKTVGVSKGYGFVCFTNSDQASDAIVKMDGLELTKLCDLLEEYTLPETEKQEDQTLHISFAHKNNKKSNSNHNQHQQQLPKKFINSAHQQQRYQPMPPYHRQPLHAAMHYSSNAMRPPQQMHNMPQPIYQQPPHPSLLQQQQQQQFIQNPYQPQFQYQNQFFIPQQYFNAVQ